MNGPSPTHTPAGGPRLRRRGCPCVLSRDTGHLAPATAQGGLVTRGHSCRTGSSCVPSLWPPLAPWGRPRAPSLPRSLPKRRRPRPGLASPRSQHWPGAAQPPGARAVASPLSRVSRAAGSSVPCGTFLALLLCPQRNVRTSVSPQQHKCLHGACPPSPAVVTRRPCSVCVSCLCQAQGRAASETGRFRGTSESWCVRRMGLTSGVLSRLVLTLQV